MLLLKYSQETLGNIVRFHKKWSFGDGFAGGPGTYCCPGPSVRGLKEQSGAACYIPGLKVGKALAESGTFFFPVVFGGFTG